jgi:hypothetical protein
VPFWKFIHQKMVSTFESLILWLPRLLNACTSGCAEVRLAYLEHSLRCKNVYVLAEALISTGKVNCNLCNGAGHFRDSNSCYTKVLKF